MNNTLLIIIAISVLGPVTGSLIGVLKKPSEEFMYNMLAFAGGVMLAISFLELIPESIHLSSEEMCLLGIGLGSVAMYIVDKLIPHVHPELCSQDQEHKLKRTTLFLITGIFLHNIPEGMAIAIGAVSTAKVSVIIALAIAIHNIPEGICTSAPYFYCTKKRLKSFLVSSSTAIPILIGLLIANLVYTRISTSLVGLIIGATAGLMIYITSDEIIPNSCGKSEDHSTIFSLILGISLVILLRLL
ncbi:MAG: ZIP family metal transporter [Methanocellales archaeon]|nr:ZIP family metal transporter [Methanocellales archaeon]MDD3291312.1 ZIP family metal transporter [Methanocellales archaeon]MDD5235806.1 ZIP family metal transporter [Methanocellales archaeon]MDD5484433.1 ZIP family metal transporter [Methanocellales archaeon]